MTYRSVLVLHDLAGLAHKVDEAIAPLAADGWRLQSQSQGRVAGQRISVLLVFEKEAADV